METDMTEFALQPVSDGFVADVRGLKLAGGISDLAFAEFDRALAHYGVLIVRNEVAMNDDDQEALIKRFGPPVKSVINANKSAEELAKIRPYFLDIATVDEAGRPLEKDSFERLYHLGNLLWHTDGTQIQPPIRVTMLSARALPPNPPDTEYADMRAAWDALPEAEKKRLEHLTVEHSILVSRAKVGLTDFPQEALKMRPPVVHPLVRTHPVTGRKSLYLASHASHIIGWPKSQGEELLQQLTEHATQKQFVYAHKWQTGDMLVWDDTFTMHRATPYDEPHPRKMRWTGAQELAPTT
jgi:alpha-ketoglutarate-dependent 2,4-dichlorophenoxyacetate dioxygenase